MNVHAAWRRAQRLGQWRQRRIRYGSPVVPPPELVPWRLVHSGCHVAPDFRRLFVVPVHALRTHRELLQTVLTLSNHKWADSTDWKVLIRRAMAATNRDRDG